VPVLHAPRRDYDGECDLREKADCAPGIVRITSRIASRSVRENSTPNLSNVAR